MSSTDHETCRAMEYLSDQGLKKLLDPTTGYSSFVKEWASNIENNNSNSNSNTRISVKPTVVLDIDHTILFVRFFADEIALKDNVTFDEKPAIVITLYYSLTLHLLDNHAIDFYGNDTIEYRHEESQTMVKKRQSFVLTS